MASGPITQISDIIVPERFTAYAQQETAEKSRLIQSGAVVRDAAIDKLLAGGGKTFNVPSFKDLDDDTERQSTDVSDSVYDPTTGGDGSGAAPQPNKIGTGEEIAVRLDRNNSWSSSSLAAILAGADPQAAIASRVGAYWVRRQQKVLIATVQGLFAYDHSTTDANHDQDDMVNDVSGSAFSDGVTNFTAEAFLDTKLTFGDSMEDVTMVMVHSVVYNRMQKLNLIDFIPDARGETQIPTYMGMQVIVDDGMPNASGVYDTWLFGPGAIRLGIGTPPVPTEVQRLPAAGNGGGGEILYNRVAWCFHPAGFAYVGASPTGGPSNANTTNNLAAATSWKRVFERKLVKMARLVTRES